MVRELLGSTRDGADVQYTRGLPDATIVNSSMSSDRFTAIRSSWFTSAGIVARRESVASPPSTVVTRLDAFLLDAPPRASRRRGRRFLGIHVTYASPLRVRGRTAPLLPHHPPTTPPFLDATVP